MRGAYWGKEIAAIEAAGQIGDVPMNAGLTVHTAWDLGMADSTVIWLIQHDRANGQDPCDRHDQGRGRRAWNGMRRRSRPRGERHDWPCPWVWGDHYPAARCRGARDGHRQEPARDAVGAGHQRHGSAPKLPVADGIQAVRGLLPNCWFDRTRCGKGIEALRMYRRDFEPKGEEYQAEPGARLDQPLCRRVPDVRGGVSGAASGCGAEVQAGYGVGCLRGWGEGEVGRYLPVCFVAVFVPEQSCWPCGPPNR